MLPVDATVLVISKGDDDLLKLDGRTAWHFPRAETGAYAGYYPADSAAAIEHLERLRAQGASHLLLPSVARWWLDHYADFRGHLERHYSVVVDRDDACLVYALAPKAREGDRR